MKKQYIVGIVALIIIIILIFVFKRDTVAPTVNDDTPNTYTNSLQTFSINVPQSFTRDESYSYTISPVRDIRGVKFTIPSKVAEGTNLSKDSYIAVESIPNAEYCTAERFFDFAPQVPDTVTEDGTTYSVNYSKDAGAGNRYEETVYAIKDSNPCIAIRYFIHYAVLENFEEGTVKEFDRTSLLQQFDTIRKSLVRK